jgi:hypothetical protein
VLKSCCLVGLALPLLFSLPDPSVAQQKPVITSAGRPVVARVFFNCGVRGAYPNATGTASHGTVTTQDATRNRCGNRNHPVVLTVYTPNPGFRGTDRVILNGGQRAWIDVVVR